MEIEVIKERIRADQYLYSLHAELERKADEKMKKAKCIFCGGEQYEERRIEYLYSYEGKYLLVPNTPVEVCINCGMIYYDAAVLKEIERRFFAIQKNTEMPDEYIRMPTAAYA